MCEFAHFAHIAASCDEDECGALRWHAWGDWPIKVAMWPRGIFEGFASILEIQPDEVRPARNVRRQRAPRVRMTDREAIASDWAAVGSDLRTALERYKREH